MAELLGYEKIVAALTAGFVLFTGGWLWSENRAHGDYQVSVTERRESIALQSPQESGTEEDWPESLLPGERINLNTADVYELQRLPGIGEARAQDIVAYRQANGPFETVDDLDKVPGIGQGILDGLRDYAAVD